MQADVAFRLLGDMVSHVRPPRSVL